MAKKKKAVVKNKFMQAILGNLSTSKIEASTLDLGAFRSEPTGFLPTGIEEIDRYVIGNGGLPYGRISEVYGPPGSGKSSLVYSCIKQCQDIGGLPILIHTEDKAQKTRLVDTFNVDPSNLALIEPSCMEEVVTSVESILDPILKSRAKDRPFVFMAWDSLAATRVRNHDSVDSKEGPAERARLLNLAFRVLPQKIAGTQSHFMLVNQNRTKIGVMIGSNKSQPGGLAPKYHSTTRLELSYAGKVGKSDRPTGIEVAVHCTKNQMAPPHRKLKSRFDFNKGWTDWGITALAKELKLIGVRGGITQAREKLEEIGWDPNAPLPKPDVEPGPVPTDVWEGEEDE